MSNQDFARMVYRAAERIGEIDPLFVAAQAALESGWGRKAIGNNLFGITAGSAWKGATKLVLTTEYFNTPNKTFTAPEKVVGVKDAGNGRYKYSVYRLFRDYPSVDACLKDHLRILSSPNFADAWPYRKDRHEFLRRIVDNVGPKYATAPNYVQVMTSLFATIEQMI